jgi:hypothetical protein
MTASLPEFGQLEPRQISKLVGVAPPRDQALWDATRHVAPAQSDGL